MHIAFKKDENIHEFMLNYKQKIRIGNFTNNLFLIFFVD